MVSYAIGVFMVGVVWLSVLYTSISMGVNEIITIQNSFLSTGTISADTQYYFDLAVNIFRSTILFGLGGLVFWAVNRSKKDVDVSFQSALPVVSSVLIMEVLAFLSIVLVFAIGRPHDMILTAIINSGITDIGTSSFTAGEPTFIQKMMYLVCVTPGILGIIVHILSSIKSVEFESTESEYEVYYEDMNGGGFQ